MANKVRAFLTILGVAIGVMVVIAMASAITGINRSVARELETLGPKTFFVERYFQGGLNISDGSDEMSPWRKMPWLKVEEAELIDVPVKVPAATAATLAKLEVLSLALSWLVRARPT